MLLHYFVADPRESDPRKARLAEHAMHMAATDKQCGIGAEIGEIAANLGYQSMAISRIAALAITALSSRARNRRR